MTGHNILLAGFGGQGILFTGKVIAYAGLMEGMEVSWLPSYGPEMRGGTANCSVCLSDDPIGSPLVTEPDILVAMNLPSLEKFENDVVPGGIIIVDSSIITKKVARDDVKVIYLPASEIAENAGIKGAANMVILGKLFKETSFCTPENLDKGLQKTIPAKKMDLLDKNRLCIRLGTENRFQNRGGDSPSPLFCPVGTFRSTGFRLRSRVLPRVARVPVIVFAIHLQSPLPWYQEEDGGS